MYFKKFIFTFGFILCGLITYLYFAIFSEPIVEKDIRSQYLKAGDFQLFFKGQPFELSSLKGQALILYFGYLSCPDVCPVGLANIRDVLNSSDEFSSVPVLFVTLDPLRDTPEKLKEYVSFFHENIIPLSGSKEQIQKVIKAYGGFFQYTAKDGSPADNTMNDYLVSHSSYYYLIDANGELTKVLDHSVKVDEIAESLRPLL